MPPRRDFPSRFLEAKQEHPQIVNDNKICSYTVSNMNAGSDTTAISLEGDPLLHHQGYTSRGKDIAQTAHCIQGKEKFARIMEAKSGEVAISRRRNHGDTPLTSAVALLLERVVPRGGLQLPNGGPFLPAGTIVGENPWITQRHPVLGSMLGRSSPRDVCKRLANPALSLWQGSSKGCARVYIWGWPQAMHWEEYQSVENLRIDTLALVDL